jgi:hypothetical protein
MPLPTMRQHLHVAFTSSCSKQVCNKNYASPFSLAFAFFTSVFQGDSIVPFLSVASSAESDDS